MRVSRTRECYLLKRPLVHTNSHDNAKTSTGQVRHTPTALPISLETGVIHSKTSHRISWSVGIPAYLLQLAIKQSSIFLKIDNTLISQIAYPERVGCRGCLWREYKCGQGRPCVSRCVLSCEPREALAEESVLFVSSFVTGSVHPSIRYEEGLLGYADPWIRKVGLGRWRREARPRHARRP